MLPDTLLEKVNQLAEAYAKSQTCRLSAHLATSEAERANHTARADYWDSQVSDLYATLTAALNTALPPTIYAAADPFAPVGVPDGHRVEVRGSIDGGNRAVSVSFTPGQAVAVGTAMIACAALAAQGTGQRLAEILPPLPPAPPVGRT